ncbi:MAG: hypothetical protein Q7R34_10090 [Dehalococcoidia bacterium]|nr:hypothetical protein [Dehalococcoidia bacterium]
MPENEAGKDQLEMYTHVLMLEYGNIANVVCHYPTMPAPQDVVRWERYPSDSDK